MRWQLSAVRGEVVDRGLHRVEHEHGRPAMVMDGLLVIRFERNLKNPEPVVLEQELVVGRGGNHSVQCWIPSRWIETPVVVCHGVHSDPPKRSPARTVSLPRGV